MPTWRGLGEAASRIEDLLGWIKARAPEIIRSGASRDRRRPVSPSSVRSRFVRKLMDAQGTIAHWTEFERGGHFPAMEQPALLVDDLRAFLRGFRQAD